MKRTYRVAIGQGAFVITSEDVLIDPDIEEDQATLANVAVNLILECGRLAPGDKLTIEAVR